MDHEIAPLHCGRIESEGTPGQPYDRASLAAGVGLLLVGQPTVGRGQATPATGRTISLPLPTGETLPAGKNPRDFRGYEEEGTGGCVRQQGSSLGKEATFGQHL